MKYRLGDITIKNWNSWDRVPRVDVLVASLFPSLTAGTFAYAVAYAGVFLGVTAVTSWALRALSPKPDFGAGSRGLLVNSREATAPHQIVYGEVRKGGTVTFIESTGDTNQYLHQIIVLAGHEVNDIGDIYINDEVVTLDGSGLVTDTKWKDGDGNSKIRIKTKTGADNQTADSDLVSETSVTSDFKGEGIAYLYVRMEYDQNVFAEGIPLFTAKVQGKKVYDPRTSTTGYSANAALCIRDYLVSTYGLDNDGDTNDTSFQAAANTCDESVTLADSGTENRYEINGVISLDQTPSDILGDMMTACAGTLFWGQGEWHLKVGEYTSSVKTFTLDDLRGPINLDTKHSRRDNFNIVRGTFTDAAQSWIRADYPEIRSSTFISDDNDIESAIDLALPFTTSSAMAQRLAKMTLFRAREQMTFTADFGLEAFEVECGDIIALTIDRYGWTAKEFEVVGWKFKNDGDAGDLRVALTLRETSSAAFSWSAEESEITANNSTLPDPRAGLTISNLAVTQVTEITTDGTHTVFARFTWDAVSNAYLNYYEVEWRKTSDSDYQSTTTVNNSLDTGLLIDGTAYTVRVRAVIDGGYKGSHSTTTFTASADTTAPSVPTSVSGSGGYRSNFISWTNPTDDDLKEIQVYVNTSNTSTGATLLGTTAATEFVHGGLAQNTTRYYFLKAVDFTGNVSGFSTGTDAVTTEADPQDGEDGQDGTNGSNGAAGDDGDTVATGRVYYQTLQSSSPSAPSASGFNFSTGLLTGLSSGWSQTQPSVDITDTTVQEWSASFTATKDGGTGTVTVSFGSVTGAIQVTTDIESDNFVSGSSGWQIQRDTGTAEFGAASIRGTLSASQIQIDNVTLDSDGSGNLIIKNSGVDTAQIKDDALSASATANVSSASVGTSNSDVLSTSVSAVFGERFLVVGRVASITTTNSAHYLDEAIIFLNNASTAYIYDVNAGTSSTTKGGFVVSGIITANSTGSLTVKIRMRANGGTITCNNIFLNIIRLKK